MEISTEYIKAQLQRRVALRELRKVADGSGVSLRTLHRIIKGASCTTANAGQLQRYLVETESMKRLPDAGK